MQQIYAIFKLTEHFLNLYYYEYHDFFLSLFTKGSFIMDLIFYAVSFLIFLIPLFALNTTLGYAIFSGIIAFIILVILLIIKIYPKFKRIKVINFNAGYNYNTESPLNKIKNYLFYNFNITYIYIIINTILSFLSSFSLTYFVKIYYSSKIYKLLSALILGIAHKSLVFPKIREFYASCVYDFENSQTRCFSIILLSAISFFLKKHEIDYLYIQSFLFVFLFSMAFDITIIYGLIGLPRATFHWFIEFLNRYAFGFSGCSTIANGLIQFIRGAVSIGICILILYFKNTYWTRTICLFISLVIELIEENLKIFLLLLVQSIVSSALFIIFNLFLTKETFVNVIEIIFFVYFLIFEFIIPLTSSISCYLFFYIQLFKSNKIIKYIRMIITSISGPIIIGCLLTDEIHLAITSLLIVHASNRCVSEPHVFGLALFIARFTLYYDFEQKSNLALNLLISLFISRKFFSIVYLLYFRVKLSMSYFSDNYDDHSPIITIILLFLKSMLINPANSGLIPAFFWSLITGSPINFIELIYYFAQPYPPKSNIFWDHPKEKFTTNEHPIESFVYLSFLDSFREKLYDMVKSGDLGIVDENSFFIFYTDDYMIVCHLISISAFSVTFQIRCAEFTKTTLCHRSEIRNFSIVNNDNFYRKTDLNKSVIYIQSIFSPVAQNVKLNGYCHYPIDIVNAFVSLSREKINYWMSYAVCYCFSNFFKVYKDFEIPEYIYDQISSEKRSLSSYVYNNSSLSRDESSNDSSDDDNNDHKIEKCFKNDITVLNEEIFDLFNSSTNSEESEKLYNFLNLIYTQIKSKMINPSFFFQDETKFDFSGLQITENCSDKLLEKICKMSGTRACLYLFLAASYLAPELSNTDEVMEFLNQTEEEYIITKNDAKEWFELLSKLKKNVSKKKKNKCKKNHDEDEEEEEEDDEDIIKNNFFTVIVGKNDDGDEGEGFFTFIRRNEKKWKVFRLHREYVRSIWASQCFDVIGMNNEENERQSLQSDELHLHNLLNQISDLPMAYPAYVSNIEKSVFVI